MSKRTRQFLGILFAIVAYYIVHEGAHLVMALIFNIWLLIKKVTPAYTKAFRWERRIKMKVETERLYLYPISDDEMRCLIDKEADTEMKQAYTEMLEGCLLEPDRRIWYAVWNMELKDAPGTIVGDFSFKGLGKDGIVEIGYGLKEPYRHHGYMSETVKVISYVIRHLWRMQLLFCSVVPCFPQ